MTIVTSNLKFEGTARYLELQRIDRLAQAALNGAAVDDATPLYRAFLRNDGDQNLRDDGGDQIGTEMEEKEPTGLKPKSRLPGAVSPSGRVESLD